LPARRPLLEAALREAGFDLGVCAPALDAFAHPSGDTVDTSRVQEGPLSWLIARHVAHDGADTLVATYVRPSSDPAAAARLRAAIVAADPSAAVTGFDAIDRALREVLARDLRLVGAVVQVIVAVAMRFALRSGRHALVAMAALACEVGLLGLAMRALVVRWHVYDALVLPVLFGVTIDESMFLLYAAARGGTAQAVRTQGPLVAATALTTAAGFAALLVCRFDGLRDLGLVGTLGVLAGLVAALVVVPSALSVLDRGR
jgi:predicted exporter